MLTLQNLTLALLVCACFVAGAPAKILAASPSPALGIWLTGGREGAIEIYQCTPQELCGRMVWLGPSDPTPMSSAGQDQRNPDPALRTRPLCGATILGGFAPINLGDTSDGWIYSPRHGANFSVQITVVEPNTLWLRGYLLVPALGETQEWQRAPAEQPRCQGLPPLMIPSPAAN